MSRIHEALLKAQREHGIHKEMLDVESLEIQTPGDQPTVSKDRFGTGGVAATVQDGAVATAVVDEPQSFRQRPWLPDVERLVFMKPEFSPGIEEFRTLRSRLLRERTRRHLKTVLITGANPSEGKTFVTSNLALAMSRHPGSRVLVVDADLRKSNLHMVFGMDLTPGLSEHLAGTIEGSAIVQQTPEPRLCVVTAGQHSDSPTELLHSHRMQQFLESMSLCFDWIFIDSPPATAVADSGVLSELCDGGLLVIATNTSVETVQKSRKEIGQKILGVVLNRAQDRARYYSYEYCRASKPRRPKATGDRRRKSGK